MLPAEAGVAVTIEGSAAIKHLSSDPGTRYSLVMLDDPAARYPLAGSVTVGRHLDNDLVIAGEDVRDFHVRIETGDRGPRIVALGAATVHLNRNAVDAVAGMKPGDELVIGHHRLRLDVESQATPCEWKLHRVGDAAGIPISRQFRVGRATDCELQIIEGHISRHHAELSVVSGTVWIEDLRSSNGTFVNGDRVIGAWRLFHGDEVAFDTMRYQLIGDAPDLTPIRTRGEPPDQLAWVDDSPAHAEPAVTAETAAVPTAATDAAPRPAREPVVEPAAGPALLGRSEPVAGRRFPLAFGRHLIGRGPDAAIHLPESSVSLRHAELDLRPDGAQLINLISTNGTWVNGVETHTCRLHDGDLIRIGRVTLQYSEPNARNKLRQRRLWMRIAALTFTLVLIALAWQLLS
jgi:pSer/pThr/pTyr-binding forkhead associated (FHA) protein